MLNAQITCATDTLVTVKVHPFARGAVQGYLPCNASKGKETPEERHDLVS